MPLHKDEILDRLARRGNVAQFVAFRPHRKNTPAQSFARIAGNEPNQLSKSQWSWRDETSVQQ
jgi:hypothetical protein